MLIEIVNCDADHTINQLFGIGVGNRIPRITARTFRVADFIDCHSDQYALASLYFAVLLMRS